MGRIRNPQTLEQFQSQLGLENVKKFQALPVCVKEEKSHPQNKCDGLTNQFYLLLVFPYSLQKNIFVTSHTPYTTKGTGGITSVEQPASVKLRLMCNQFPLLVPANSPSSATNLSHPHASCPRDKWPCLPFQRKKSSEVSSLNDLAYILTYSVPHLSLYPHSFVTHCSFVFPQYTPLLPPHFLSLLTSVSTYLPTSLLPPTLFLSL